MPKVKPSDYPSDEDDDLYASDGQQTESDNQTENERANNAASAVGLTKPQEGILHDRITGQPRLTYAELLAEAQNIKDEQEDD